MNFFSILLLGMLTLSGCSNVSEHRDWEFIQQVGGLSIIGQDKNPNWLIIRGDVSGLKEFTQKPTWVSSVLAVKNVEKIVDENTIKIYVVTTVVSKKYPNSEIFGINITGVKEGTYKIQYLNPDNTVIDLKQIYIQRQLKSHE